MDWNVWNLIGYHWDQWGSNGDYEPTGRVDGEWHVRFPVTIDKSVNETFAINQEQNGITVKSGIKTKAGLVLEVELPDFRQEPYNDPYNDPDLAICDAQGNALQWIMVLYDGQEDLSFHVTTKDEEPVSLAEIGFQVP